MKSIKLKTSDDHMVEVTEAVALQSGVIKNYVEASDGDDSNAEEEIVIPLLKVRAEILRKVIEWIEKKQSNSDDDDETAEDWERRYVDIDLDVMYELIMAANYLDVNALLHRCCQKIADMIDGQTPEKIRELFGIPNDFTPQEEEALRKQNAWTFEPRPHTRSTSGSGPGSTSRSTTNQ